MHPVFLRRRIPVTLFGIFIISLCGHLACSSRKPDPEPKPDPAALRVVAEGTFLGGLDLYDSHSWRGIPFARPPVGPLRWQAPEPPVAFEGTREAVQFAAICPQLAGTLSGAEGIPAGTPRGSEDCLSLNVFAPRFKPADVPNGKQALPVVVWIHGGANRTGGSDFYHGGKLAAGHDLIVVTVNYRLGPFGWFYHPALAEGATRAEASGNFALLDLIAALRWVRANIAAFGGDPDRVTIMGESAGANNVLSLLLSPRARGLFQRAIAQSGLPGMKTPDLAARYSDEGGHENSSAEITMRLLVAEGRAPNLAEARKLADGMAPADLARFLRSLDANRILDAFRDNLNGENPELSWYPFVSTIQDGFVLPRGDLAAMAGAGGSVGATPLLIGGNRDEEKLYLATEDEYLKRYFGLIPSIREPDLYAAMGDHLSATWRVKGVHRPARAFRALNPAIFAYRFDWDEEPSLFGTDLGEVLGAAHAFEIPFVFGHFRLGPADPYMFTDGNLPGRKELSDAMMSYWARFIRTGDPGRGVKDDQEPWEAYGANERLMILDTRADGGRRMIDRPLTRELILEAIAADERLNEGDRRCRVYRRMADKNRLIGPGDLPGLGCQTE